MSAIACSQELYIVIGVKTTLLVLLIVLSASLEGQEPTVSVPGVLSQYSVALHEQLSPACELIQPATLLEYKLYDALAFRGSTDEFYSPELGKGDFIELATAAPKRLAKSAKQSAFDVRPSATPVLADTKLSGSSCPELEQAVFAANKQRSERRAKLQEHLYRLDQVEASKYHITLPTPIHEAQPKSHPKAEPQYGKLKRQGIVRVMIAIGPDGKVDDAKVATSVDPVLDQEAMETVREWEFTPARMKGLPVAVQMPVEVNFYLY